MSEDVLGQALPTPPEMPATAGSLLRAAREKKGVHIATLAASMKVSPRKLEALEGNRLAELPDATFARALAQTMCRLLQIDARTVLDLMPPAGSAATAVVTQVQSKPFRDSSATPDKFNFSTLGPWVWAAMALVVAAAAVFLLPATWLDFSGRGVSKAATPAEPLPVAAEVALPAQTPAAQPAPAAAGGVASPQSVSAAAPSTSSAQRSGAGLVGGSVGSTSGAVQASGYGTNGNGSNGSNGNETVFSAPPATTAGPAVSARALVITTTESAWVEVRDANDQVLINETVTPGRTVGLDGTKPLKVMVGNASATRMTYLGHAIDVVSNARENVARFELK